MRRETALSLIFVFAIVGLAVASYQTYEYYMVPGGCQLGGTFSCSAVTESRFGAFPPGSGIATAAWGVPWWLSVTVLAGSLLAGKQLFQRQETALFGLGIAGLLFAVYLLTVELYILPQETGSLAICPFCTIQHALILGVTGLAGTIADQPLGAMLRR